MKIYVSHTGINGWGYEFSTDESVLEEAIIEMSDSGSFDQIYNIVFIEGKISSSTRIFANVDVVEENDGISVKFYEKKETVELKSLRDEIANYSNILISVFEAGALIHLLNASMKVSSDSLVYKNEDGVNVSKTFRPMIEEVEFQTEVKSQTLYEFVNGKRTLNELKYSNGQVPHIAYDSNGNIDKTQSALLPEDLAEAIQDIWGLEDGNGKLRLFQEDSLFFISEQLLKLNTSKEKHLLLSMPTGGGKTEAFMIPIISSIYEKKQHETSDRLKSIVIYPTNALANDQAMRFVELIYGVNKQLIKKGVPLNKLISIGILSGDTPSTRSDLTKESLIKICPECGKTHWIRDNDNLICQNPDCGTNLGFCRLTRESIMNNPPDILITNPDEINSCLHNPNRSKLFYSAIDSIVFDEVHVYQGIFGCHVAHLLRRMEEISGNKPLYIGMSATIKNAKELAALLFDEKLDKVKYINDNNHEYTDQSKPAKQRLHVMLRPALMSGNGNSVRHVKSMSVAGIVGIFIGHLISDSHYRKSIIFTNYRSEADDLTSYVRERERLDIEVLFRSILKKYKAGQPLDDEEVDICRYMIKWFTAIENAVGKIAPQTIIGWNRGGLEKETRIRSIHSFSRNSMLDDNNDKYPIDIMIATKSLEVGIDIGDVTTVINASAPYTANEYVQRVGRGGRKKDSLAITVINPENAIDAYFRKHFSDYVVANNDIYEEAPIILNNDIIINRHLQARLIDYVVKLLSVSLQGSWSISCRNFVDLVKISDSGKVISLGPNKTVQDVQDMSKAIYRQIFDKEIDGQKVFNRLQEFLKNETEILNTKIFDLSEDYITNVFFDMLLELNKNIQNGARNKWELDECLIGYGGHWKGYTPNLRGNGSSIELHDAISGETIETLPRQNAFNQMPPAMNEKQVITLRSGISSFKVDGIYKDTDGNTEKTIKKILGSQESIREYFSTKIDGFPDPYDEDFIYDFKVTVPNALSISYFPSRFYCSTCNRGLVSGTDFNEVRFGKDGIYCNTCHNKVERLHQVYFCPDCGGVFDPPAGKICINPDCPDYKKFYALFKQNNFRMEKRLYEHFNLRLTKDLEWECQTCKCKMNYSSTRDMIVHNQKKRPRFVNEVVKQWNHDDTDTGIAVRFKKWPEFFSTGAGIRNRESVFTCKHDRTHKNIQSISAPRVRTIAFNYVGNKNSEELCKSIENEVCSITFREGFVLQLASQFMRRYVTGNFDNKITRINTEDIFDNNLGFNSLGNYYESHLAWIKFGDKLKSFINEKKYTCDGNCSQCDKFSRDKLDLGENMKPKPALEPWNFDSTTGTPKKPDFRGKFCEKALLGECKQLDCSSCRHLNKDAYLKYLTVHTLKHAILWAMPKYAGVNITDLKGEIYPNDGMDGFDLVLVDNNEGGSGSIILIQRHWDEIWNFASEIIRLTKNNEANILLNHYCFRNNADLCPYIATDFFDYIES